MRSCLLSKSHAGAGVAGAIVSLFGRLGVTYRRFSFLYRRNTSTIRGFFFAGVFFQGSALGGSGTLYVLNYRFRAYHYFYYFSYVLPGGAYATFKECGQVGNVLRRPCAINGYGYRNATASAFAGGGKSSKSEWDKRLRGVLYGHLALASFFYSSATGDAKDIGGTSSESTRFFDLFR